MSEAAAIAGAPLFPPLFRGEEVGPGPDPMAKAVARAALGTDPGLVAWREAEGRLEAALVLAPEVPLADALPAAFAAALGLADAIGALGPPETAVHFDWPSAIRVNGAVAGRLRVAAATADPAAEPDWMVAGIEIGLAPGPGAAPGADPGRTWLSEEGCGEIGGRRLLESWSRHSLVWLNDWADRGAAPLHEAWRAKAWGLGEPLPDGAGVFVGLDERMGQLVRTPEGTVLRPLAEHLPERA